MSKRVKHTNVNIFSIKSYLLLFLFLLIICGGYSGLFLHAIRDKSVASAEWTSVSMLAYVPFIINI